MNIEPPTQIYFPTKLKRNQFDCKLTLGSHYIDAADKIHSFLNENELEQLVQQTQFGNLIRYAKDYLNSNQLLWFLMSRQSLDCGNNEFWMVFRKKPIRFSLLEYCLITGLNCSKIYPPIPEDDSFLHRHFNGKSSLCLRDLKAKIDGFGNGVGEEVDVEKLKLASLYFLVVVLGPQRKNKNTVVNLDWVKLVDDFESFNKYPWGRVAFDEVLFGLRKDLEEKFKSFKNLAERRKNDAEFSGYGSLHISGFIHPLQIFAYECFPSVAEVFATRRDGANVPLPRMCHWVTKKWRKNHSPSMRDVTKAFCGDPEEAIVGMLTPIDTELLSAHYLTGDFVDSSPNVVTLRISELISQGATVVCSEHPLADQDQDEDIEMDDADSETTPPRPHISRRSSSHTHCRSSSDRVVHTYSRTSRDKRQASLLSPPLHIQSPSHADSTRSSPPHRAGPSLPATDEVRLTRLEDRLTVLQKEQTDGFAQIMDMLRHMQKDLLSIKQMIEDGKTKDVGETSGRIPETQIEEADPHFRDTGADTIIEEADPHFRETGADTIGVTEVTFGRTLDDVGTTLEISAKMLNDSVFTAINAPTFEQRINRVVESNWPRIKIDIDHATYTSRKSGLVLSYSKQWFIDLMTRGCWLYDDLSNNTSALAVSDLTHVGQNSPYMISRDSIQNGGLSQVAESTANHSKKLQDDMQELGQKIKHHEDNVKYLMHHKNKLEESIVDMQGKRARNRRKWKKARHAYP